MRDEDRLFLDIQDLLNLLPVSRRTIERKVARGEIPGACRFGRRRLFYAPATLGWLKNFDPTPVHSREEEGGRAS